MEFKFPAFSKYQGPCFSAKLWGHEKDIESPFFSIFNASKIQIEL